MNCYTNLYIRGPKAEIKHLYYLLKKWTKKNAANSNWGKNGFENILMGAELQQKRFSVQAVIDFMDTIQYYETPKGDYYFTVNYKSEKRPVPQLWYAILEKFAPHCKAYWFAMDTENNLYMTNDAKHVFINFDYMVICRVHEDNPFSHMFSVEDSNSAYELLLLLNKVCTPKPLAEMIKQANSMPLQSDEVFHIYKLRVVA